MLSTVPVIIQASLKMAMAMTDDPLVVQLFGSFRVMLYGEPVTSLESDKVRALLTYLAVEAGRPQRREKLVGLLWPDWPERSARASLSQALYNLRSAIGDRQADPPFLLVTPQTIQFNRESDHSLDVARLTELPADPTASQLERAVAAYHDPFLADFSLPDSTPFEEWATATREELHRRALEALQRLATHHETRGEYLRALNYARRGVSLDPTWEVGHRSVMRILALNGERSSALAHYEVCRQVLEAELGVEPGEETQALYDLLVNGEQPAPLTAAPPVPDRPPRAVGPCPYRGLSAFREDDATFFFGREAFVERLVEAVGQQPMVAVVVGASGSGKSSAVFAGLLPRLRSESDWLVTQLRPGGHPFEATAAALLPLLEPGMTQTDRLIETQKLGDALRQGQVPLFQVIENVLTQDGNAKRALLVIDQFEELYTLCSDLELQRAFLDTLLAAVETGDERRISPFVLLLTMRADFMGQALSHRPFADALQEASVIMGPMTQDELGAAIEKPAEVQGAAFEEGLVERILDDVGQESGNLPLLEFALTLLWEQHSYGWLTHAGYEEIGRVDGALARYADQVYGELDDTEQERSRQVFVQLVRPGEGTEDTRRVATRVELGEARWGLAQHLADKRLVVTGRDAVSGVETVEVVHEALIGRWGQLRAWMEADRSFRTWQERLRAALRSWEATDQDEGALLRGAPLAEAEGWLAERESELSDFEKEYIAAGAALRTQRTIEREARRRRTILMLAAGLVAALILALMAGQQWLRAEGEVDARTTAQVQEAVQRATAEAARAEEAAQRALAETSQAQEAVQRILAETAQAQEGSQRETAEAAEVREAAQRATAEAASEVAAERAEIAFSRELAAAALNALEIDPELSVLLALQALVQAETLEAENALHRTLPSLHLIQTWRAHDLWLTDMAISRDGGRLATGGNSSVKVWDLTSGRQLFTTSPNWVEAVALSPDGLRLAVLGQMVPEEDLRVEIWGIASNKKLVSFLTGGVRCVSFSPDGSRLVTCGYDGDARVWDAATGELIARLQGHDPHAYSAATAWLWGSFSTGLFDATFSPDGSRLATAGIDGNVKVWDLTEGEGQELLTLSGHAGPIYKVAFRPDGMRLATTSEEGVTNVWDLAPGPTQGLPLLTLNHGNTLAYSSDGTLLVTAAREGTARVWEADSGREVLTLYGTGAVWHVEFALDGTRLVTGNEDGSVRVWDFSPDHELLTLSAGGIPAFSPDGTRLAIAGLDGSVSVWDPVSGEKLLSLSGHTESVAAVAFSPDGTRLATASADGRAKMWDVASGEELFVLRHGSFVGGVDFSSDGARLLTCSSDRKATIWDAASGQRLLTLVGTPFIYCAFSPDGAHLATIDRDEAVIVWDATTGEHLFSFPDESNFVQLAYSPGGERLAAGDKKGLTYVWDLTSPERPRVHMLKGHTAYITGIAFSPTGDRLVTAGEDASARVWDAASGQELLTLSLQGTSAFGVAFSPDGKRLAVGGLDGTTRLYTLDLEELVALARDRVTRSLTDEECQRYLHVPQCP